MNQDDAISLAVTSILRDGCSDITTEVLELHLIEQFREGFEGEIKSKLKFGSINEMEFEPLHYLLTPKNRYVFDYRKAAIITPSSLAKFLAIVFQYAEIVENKRVPVSEKIVFSCRFSPNEKGIFSKDVGYSEWREETKKRAQEAQCKFVVSCDIAAFYDRVNIHRIESTLESIGVENSLVKKTNELLLFWSQKDSYGIPVGNVASRILAETALIDIDEYLISEGILYTRYVDDFRLFAPNLLVAQEWMNKLTLRLFRDGLMLNTGKTYIKSAVNNEFPVENNTELDKDDEVAEAVLKTITKLTGGYNRIARNFIMPAEEKHEIFSVIKLEDELKVLTSQSIVEFSGIQKIVIASLVQEKFELLLDISKICTDYLYGMDYFIDMLIKNSEFISSEVREGLADMYVNIVESERLNSFEWHYATIARLLSHPYYFRKDALIKIFKAPRKDMSTYASFIALEGLKGKLSRSDFKTIREYFNKSDEWEKRRLLFLSDALPEEERRAWGKSIKPLVSRDFLAAKLCDLVVKGKEFKLNENANA